MVPSAGMAPTAAADPAPARQPKVRRRRWADATPTARLTATSWSVWSRALGHARPIAVQDVSRRSRSAPRTWLSGRPRIPRGSSPRVMPAAIGTARAGTASRPGAARGACSGSGTGNRAQPAGISRRARIAGQLSEWVDQSPTNPGTSTPFGLMVNRPEERTSSNAASSLPTWPARRRANPKTSSVPIQS